MLIESLLRPAVLNLASKVAGKSRGTEAVRLDKGEFPYPPAPQVIEAIQAAASGVNRYPEILTPRLREVLAGYCGVAVDRIAIGNGSDDLIESVLKICIEVGDEVIVPVPSFFVYGAATAMLGGRTVNVQRQADFDLDIPAILAAVNPRTKLIFIANPNNPTANGTARQNLVEILEQVNCFVVVDECYFEIYGETVVDLVDRYPHLIVLRSLSKSFGLAGIRIGYSIAQPQVTDYLYRVAQIFPVDVVAVAAGIAAIAAIDYARQKLREIVVDRDKLAGAIGDLGFKVYRSDTNFLFVSTSPLEMTAADIVHKLASNDIYVADFGHKPGLDDSHFRVATGIAEENEKLITVLGSEVRLLQTINQLPENRSL
jgi:histidinol-phosphate aminotransferase